MKSKAYKDAERVAKMRRSGDSVQKIAAVCNKSVRAVYNLMSLLELPADVLEMHESGKITLNVALVLGKISADDRGRLREVLFTSRGRAVFTERKALATVRRWLRWQKYRESLDQDVAAELDVHGVQDADGFGSREPGVVRCDTRPLTHELAVHAREWDQEDIPTWGALAEKHGARCAVVPDQAGEPVFYVEKDPLITAELVLGEKDPEGCIFPIPGGDGRRKQTAAAKKIKAKREAEKHSIVATVDITALDALEGWAKGKSLPESQIPAWAVRCKESVPEIVEWFKSRVM